MKAKLLLAVSVFALAVAAPVTNGWAQDDEEEAFINLGGARINPSVTVTEEYNDNIYTEANNKDGDFITKISPKLVVDAGRKPDDVQLTLGATQSLYADDTSDNRLDANAALKARRKLNDSLSFYGFTDWRHLHSSRGDTESNPTADASEPPVYDVMRAKASLTATAGAIKFKPRLGFTHYDYSDYRRLNGTKTDQDYRDRNEYVAGGRAGYMVNSDFEVYADAEFNPRAYSVSSATERSSDGGNYLLGVSFRPNKNLKAEIAAGFMNRSYDKGAVYKDIDTFDIHALMDWDYQEGGTLRLSLDRGIYEATDAGAGGIIRTDIRAKISRQLHEDLSGHLNARYSRYDYQGGLGASGGTSDRADNFYEAGMGLEYALTKQFALVADYTYGHRNSNLASAEYDQNVFMVGLQYIF